MSTEPGTHDKKGVPFDPAEHQATKDGTGRQSNDGRWIRKGKRGPKNGKGKAQLEAKRAQKAPAPAQSAPAQAETPPANPAPVAPAPVEIAPAKASEILENWPEQTIDDAPGSAGESGGAVEQLEGDQGEPAAAANPGSVIPPDASAPGGDNLTSEGLAIAAVEIFEARQRMRVDEKEWELEAPEKEGLVSSFRRILEKHEISPDLSPEGDFFLKLIVVTYRRAHLPKTRVWLGEIWQGIKSLFVRKKPPVPLDEKPAKVEPPKPAQEAPNPQPEPTPEENSRALASGYPT